MADEAVLIVAVSGRALAQSARRGGYIPLVADFFGDRDTLAAAAAHVRLVGPLRHGITESSLVEAVAKLRRHHQPIGLVYGTGFEDRPALLAKLAARRTLFGNDAAVVASVKDPMTLAALCARLEIPSPEVSLEKPTGPAKWLVKRLGGSGGAHINPLSQARAAGSSYYQRKASGTAVSALFLADGERARIVGFSTQWCSPAAGKPYRYGGAVRPAQVAPQMAAVLTDAVERLAAATKLVGLNSADFLLDGERYWLLEINPRPGATLDIFEPIGGSLFALHVAACKGKLKPVKLRDDCAEAAAIVYAAAEICRVPDFEWPDWTADRPHAGGAIMAGEPLCTVYACARTAAEAKALVDERHNLVLARIRARQ